jgi:hypothetical protein
VAMLLRHSTAAGPLAHEALPLRGALYIHLEVVRARQSGAHNGRVEFQSRGKAQSAR